MRDLTGMIIGGAIEVHRHLGPGLLESTYEHCLLSELEHQNLVVEQQVSLPLLYKGKKLDCGYRLDLLINDQVVVEVKSVEKITALHHAQVLTYLKLSQYKVALLINFNVPRLTDGILRIVHNY